MAPCGISKLINFPILAKKYPVNKAWQAFFSGLNGATNQAATFLHLNTDPTRFEEWGRAPMNWQNDVGSVIAVRADKQDLAPQQLEVLCHFCQFKMGPLFGDSNGCMNPTKPMDKKAVLNEMTKEKFATYFEEYRKEKLKGGQHWVDAKPPNVQ